MDTLERTEARVAAEVVWGKLDDNQKMMVRIGMFPAEVMREYEHIPSPGLAVALMDMAKHDGGMIA